MKVNENQNSVQGSMFCDLESNLRTNRSVAEKQRKSVVHLTVKMNKDVPYRKLRLPNVSSNPEIGGQSSTPNKQSFRGTKSRYKDVFKEKKKDIHQH